jgi:hypothetical protein
MEQRLGQICVTSKAETVFGREWKGKDEIENQHVVMPLVLTATKGKHEMQHGAASDLVVGDSLVIIPVSDIYNG